MKVGANSIRIGNILEHNGELYQVMKKDHTKPGKGGAFVQLELKNIVSNTKLNERFRSTENVEIARVDAVEYQYLYESGDNITVMNNETFEQIDISKELFGEKIAYLKEGLPVMLEIYNEKIINATPPAQVELIISETEAVVKGQTAAGSNKPAILENGIRVMVPPFINSGDLVKIDTENNSYLERVKKS